VVAEVVQNCGNGVNVTSEGRCCMLPNRVRLSDYRGIRVLVMVEFDVFWCLAVFSNSLAQGAPRCRACPITACIR
jgi:hypothetical protein